MQSPQGDRNAPPSGWGQQPPGYGQAPPDHNQPPPGYGQAPPDYGQPGYAQQPPGYGQPPPGHEPPRRRRRKRLWITLGVIVGVILLLLLAPLIVTLVAGLLGGGGGQVSNWADRVTYRTDGDAQLGDLRVGKFNYIDACEAFTHDDYVDVTGDTHSEDVAAVFALRTYADSDPLRTYKSSCDRGIGTVRVTVEQFSDKATQGKTTALLPGFTSDEEAAARLGDGAGFESEGRHLRFHLDNKQVFVTTSSSTGSREEVRALLLEVASRVKERIEELSTRPSKVFRHHPKGVKIGRFPYRDACRLIRPEDYRRILGLEPDEARIETQYELEPGSEYTTHSECLLHTLPAKAQPVDSGDAGEPVTDHILELRTEQHSDIEDAKEEIEPDAEDLPVRGVGDDAYLRPLDDGQNGQLLHVRKGNVTFKVQLFAALGGGEPVLTDQQENLKALRKFAKTVARRLD